jgi:hypothetical protein
VFVKEAQTKEPMSKIDPRYLLKMDFEIPSKISAKIFQFVDYFLGPKDPFFPGVFY